MSRRLGIQLAPSSYRRGLAALALAAVVSAGFAGTAAAQTAPRCGQVLTASVTLQADLTNCAGDGLVIGASGVVVNLNGKSVDGVGLGRGIRNDGFDHVTVRNGRLQEFDYGISLSPGSQRTLLEGLRVERNEFAGVVAADADDTTIKANTVSGQSKDGLVVDAGSDRAVVAGNTVTGNQGRGLVVLGATGARIERNGFRANSDTGVYLEAAARNMLLANSVTGSSDAGIELVHSSGNRLEANTVASIGDTALFLRDGSNDNWALRNRIEASGDDAITVKGSDAEHLLDNVARGSNDNGISLQETTRTVVGQRREVQQGGRHRP